MILEQGEERGEQRARRRDILEVGEERLGAADESVQAELEKVKDVERLERILRKAARAAAWREILDTP